MRGPFSISQVNSLVDQTKPGAYILSRDGKTAHYVGRSDTNLASRIASSAKEEVGYTHFWFEHTTSPMQAYYLECDWWHKYKPSNLDNINHPAVPPGTYWKCPIPGCPWS